MYKLSRWLYSRVLASHAGGPGSDMSVPDMSVLGPLEEYSDSGDPDVIVIHDRRCYLGKSKSL